MNTTTTEPMFRNWGMLLLRGLISILFGILVLLFPGIAFESLILVIAAYLVFDGLSAVFAALSHRAHYPHWWIMLIDGLIGIIAGILAFLYPGLAGVTLVTLIAFWAIITGVIEIVAAWRLRQIIKDELFLGLGGLLSVLFGIAVLLQPGVGIVAILSLIGVYSIVFGVLYVVLAFRLRSHHPSTAGISMPGTAAK